MSNSRNRSRRSARQSLICSSLGSSPRTGADGPISGVQPVQLPVPFPVLDPFDVLDVLSRSAAIPGPGSSPGSSVCLVLCDAAAEVVSVVIVHHTPSDVARQLSDLLHQTFRRHLDDPGSAQVASVIVALCRDGHLPEPDQAELQSWAVLEERLVPLGIEVPDLLVVTPEGWSSVVESNGTGWYDGTPLRELLGIGSS